MRVISIILLLIALILREGVFVQADVGKDLPAYAIVLSNNVNIRAGYSTNFEVIGQLDEYVEVLVLAKERGWYKIRLPGYVFCFVHKDYINGNVVQANRLRVRSGAGLNFSVLGMLDKGQRVEIVERNGEWIKIRPPQECVGWVKADYLRLPEKKTITKTLKPTLTTKKEENKSIEACGKVDELGKIFNRQGTHKLMGDKKVIYYLKSENIDLNHYVHQNVHLTGQPINVRNYPYTIIDVQDITIVQ